MASRLARAINLLIGGLVALTLTVGPLRAAEDQPLSLRYGVYWAGFQVATLALDHRVGPRHYRSELLVQTVGVVEKLAHYRSRILATGWLEADEDLAPVSFSSEYRSRRRIGARWCAFDPRERRRRRSQDHEAGQAGHQQGAGGAAQERDRPADRVLPAA